MYFKQQILFELGITDTTDYRNLGPSSQNTFQGSTSKSPSELVFLLVSVQLGYYFKLFLLLLTKPDILGLMFTAVC